jgi:hypothetical protein
MSQKRPQNRGDMSRAKEIEKIAELLMEGSKLGVDFYEWDSEKALAEHLVDNDIRSKDGFEIEHFIVKKSKKKEKAKALHKARIKSREWGGVN